MSDQARCAAIKCKRLVNFMPGAVGAYDFDADAFALQKLQQFSREKIPERIVHARGAAAFGEFEVTSDELAKYTDAEIFQKSGEKVPIQARFSTVLHPRGSPESLRDVRGFTVRFQTQQGNWDLVGAPLL